MKRSIALRSAGLLGGRPKICVPLSGESPQALKAEVAKAHEADLLEWRMDAFKGDVLAALPGLKAAAGNLPLLLTLRTRPEGGAADTADYQARVQALIESGMADLIDIELRQGEEAVRNLTALARQRGVVSVVSAHFFTHTPGEEELLALFARMEALGADLPKVAAMPKSFSDVLALMAAAAEAAQKNSPLIAISMGELGRVSRLCGADFGSCISFGAGENASAPGQIPAALMRSYFDLWGESSR